MEAVLPLLETVLAALNEDALLPALMGGEVRAGAMEMAENDALPFVTVDLVTIGDWSAGDFDGSEIVFQVAAHFERGKAGSSTGVSDVAQAGERIRSVLSGRDGFDLNASPAQGESLRLDFQTGPMKAAPSKDLRLVMCRFVSAAIIPGLIDDPVQGVRTAKTRGQSISGVVTFRALISPAN